MMLRKGAFALTAALALLTALGPLSTDMYLPALPAIGHAFGAGPATVQMTLSVFLIGFAAGQIVYGPLSDQYGRRPLLLIGLALFVAGSLACALATSIGALMLARFIQALGACGPVVLARAVVRDLYEGPAAAQQLARMGTIMGLTPAAAPVIGGLAQARFGWTSSFWIMAGLGLLGVIISSRMLPETAPANLRQPLSVSALLRSYVTLARHTGFRAWTALMALTYGGLFAYISGSSFVLQGVYGLNAPEFGAAFAIGVSGYIAGTLIAPPLVRRVGLSRTVTFGVMLLGAGSLAMLGLALAGPRHAAGIVAPMTLYLAGVGLVMPQAMAAALTPFARMAGAASSLAGFVQMSFGALVGLGVGHALGDSAMPLPLALTATSLCAAAVLALTHRARNAAPDT